MKSYFNFLRRNKAYALIDVLGLALSMMFVVLIGCYWWQETHIDSQQEKADRMYFIGLDLDGQRITGTNWHVQRLLRERFPEIESSTALFRNHRWLSYNDEHIETDVFFVDSTFYDIFSFKLLQGDPGTVLDDPRSAVVTEEYARRVWGDEDPMGQTILFNINEEPFVVTGVMEPMSNTILMTADHKPVDMLLNFQMVKYVNWNMTTPEMNNGTGAEVVLLAKEGTDLTEMAEKYNDALKEHFWILQLSDYKGKILIEPYKDAYLDEIDSGNINHGNPKLTKLLFLIGFVILLFAVMNYINLTVALAGKRAKEMATRRLLGEGKGRIMWRLIKESTLMCTVSFIIGIGFALLAKPYAEQLLDTPISFTACLNWATVLFMVIIILIMGLASGITPALLISSVKPLDAVKGAIKKKSNMTFGKIFIVLQNVCTIVLVASAITMFMQIRHILSAPLGYDTHGIMQVMISQDQEQVDAYVSELKGLSCVEKVSLCWTSPLSRGNNNTLSSHGKTISYQTFKVDTAYMDLLGLKLKKDNHLISGEINYVNEQTLAENGLDENAMEFPYFDEKGVKIAGITEDFLIGDILSSQHPIIITVGKPFEDFWPWNILIKVNGDEDEALEQVKAKYAEVFESMSDYVFQNVYLDDIMASTYEKQHKLSIIVAIFAGIAIIISMLGLVAMSTFYVRQRSKEIAVRKVMGGSSASVLARLVKSFMTYVVIAAVIAVPIIYYIMNDWLSEYSYRISIYWWIYAVAIAQSVIVCFFSVVIQSHRAANANPVLTLKQND